MENDSVPLFPKAIEDDLDLVEFRVFVTKSQHLQLQAILRLLRADDYDFSVNIVKKEDDS